MINLMKGYKNQVTASRFLAWYFSEVEMAESFGRMAITSLKKEGSFNISARMLFDDCGYIPQYICENKNGDAEYTPSEVVFIQD